MSVAKHVDIRLRVRYAETDQMGVAYYSNHFIWFELGRTEFFRKRGFVYKELEEREGCYATVAEARCRYHAPARYDDMLTVHTWLKAARGRVIHFEYEVRGENGIRVATGETLHVITDKNGRPRSLPAKYVEGLLGQRRDSPRRPAYAKASAGKRRGHRVRADK